MGLSLRFLLGRGFPRSSSQASPGGCSEWGLQSFQCSWVAGLETWVSTQQERDSREQLVSSLI